MKAFAKNYFIEVSKEEICNEYLSFYKEHLNHLGIDVYFDNVCYTNGMSVYISFVKEGSEILQMRHSDHANNVGYGVFRGTFDLKTNGDLLPTLGNVKKVIEILERFKN